MEKTAERLLLIKTSREMFDRVSEAIRSVHPYEVPEIIALPVTAGHAPYLAWIAAETGSRLTPSRSGSQAE